jgi:hypothetical protein
MAKGYKTGGRRAGSLNKWTLGRPYREAHGIVEPPRQKRRKTGGRKAGTPNKKTRRLQKIRAEIMLAGAHAHEAAQRPEMEPWDERRHAHVVRGYYEGSRRQRPPPQAAPAPPPSAPPPPAACPHCLYVRPAKFPRSLSRDADQ